MSVLRRGERGETQTRKGLKGMEQGREEEPESPSFSLLSGSDIFDLKVLDRTSFQSSSDEEGWGGVLRPISWRSIYGNSQEEEPDGRSAGATCGVCQWVTWKFVSNEDAIDVSSWGAKDYVADSYSRFWEIACSSRSAILLGPLARERVGPRVRLRLTGQETRLNTVPTDWRSQLHEFDAPQRRCTNTAKANDSTIQYNWSTGYGVPALYVVWPVAKSRGRHRRKKYTGSIERWNAVGRGPLGSIGNGECYSSQPS
ncbi:hypothetical protein SODALDRAFT_354192 [Sodiomyces alkalinus F11]|uniref:Uncharacterized protein n=1 Tax=Sodiomyces alkalinus (strain CBS 110278 / VKM F-3762 / F11) TaxID=1314773 RepID=A0A3N2Q625_SODAK|nr:hypothetical protein SODALDRAFT_354192 [Sodiomyces alkalinus F11]ROT42075.1 hypothetical protein SODALDRAFT_354192 [Sodiomyces alkalinus F11]